MNVQNLDILKAIKENKFTSQRELSEITGYSLGTINSGLKSLKQENFLDSSNQLTSLAKALFQSSKPKNAIILAAGLGMRMTPMNFEIAKGLVEIRGETLIERLIKQLLEVGVEDIYIVVGYLKESYEYLMDKFNVKLIVNREYAKKNSLHSLALMANKISNSYILPCDLWCKDNPFSKDEAYSWIFMSKGNNKRSKARVNRNKEIVRTNDINKANKVMGLAYILEKEAVKFRKNLVGLDKMENSDSLRWEEALFDGEKMLTFAKQVRHEEVFGIDTYEDLRELDSNSNSLKSDAIEIIKKVFDVKSSDIKNIEILKKGMTNRSFLFTVKNSKYIMRIPGDGTEKLINRKQEQASYNAISSKGLCDDPIYINGENGYKIAKFIEGIRSCDSRNEKDLIKSMKLLRSFHDMKLKSDYEFDLFDQIEFYQSLWDGARSIYRDYETTKKRIFALKDFVEENVSEKILSHIDANEDNFLFYMENGEEKLQLTDWEYAAMQDPHLDIAMFAIYSLYSKEETDKLIDIYFESKADGKTRIKIYAYMAISGLVWSNWCEYKMKLGIEFGEYSLRQYRYAKDFYNLTIKEMKKIGMDVEKYDV